MVSLNTGTLNTTGEIITTANKIGIVGSYPTLYLRHINSTYRSVMIHCNGNQLYFLGAPYGGTPTQDNWTTVGSGTLPLVIDLVNNYATFGGNVGIGGPYPTNYPLDIPGNGTGNSGYYYLRYLMLIMS